jgi:hypothetical protein
MVTDGREHPIDQEAGRTDADVHREPVIDQVTAN